MGLKRKYSDASPLSASSFGAISTPDAQSPAPFPQHSNNFMDLDTDASTRSNAWDFTSASRVKAGDWGNRTRKRHRDGRPDEHTIHENTVNKLFAAQKRSQWHVSPIPSEAPIPTEQPAITVSQPQKSTLHSFWRQIPAPPVQAPIFSYQESQQEASQTPRCEDCDATLQSEVNSVDVDMDMGGEVDSNPFACHDCGKSVCSTCAVVSATRHCLQCATRGRNSRRWW